MPLTEPYPPPKLHSSPFVWSQGCVLLQSSKSCCAQTLQHPQPSSMRRTPAAHLGMFGGHRQSFGHEAATWDKTWRQTLLSTCFLPNVVLLLQLNKQPVNEQMLLTSVTQKIITRKTFHIFRSFGWKKTLLSVKQLASACSPSWSPPLLLYTPSWRMRRLKRCPKTMRGMLLHVSSHKSIRSRPPTTSPPTQWTKKLLLWIPFFQGFSFIIFISFLLSQDLFLKLFLCNKKVIYMFYSGNSMLRNACLLLNALCIILFLFRELFILVFL